VQIFDDSEDAGDPRRMLGRLRREVANAFKSIPGAALLLDVIVKLAP
jgi:hypothetical protein